VPTHDHIARTEKGIACGRTDNWRLAAAKVYGVIYDAVGGSYMIASRMRSPEDAIIFLYGLLLMRADPEVECKSKMVRKKIASLQPLFQSTKFGNPDRLERGMAYIVERLKDVV